MAGSVFDDCSASPALLESIIEWAPLAIIVSDVDGLICLCNREAQAAFGYAKAEMLGHCIDMLILPAQRQAHRAARSHFLQHPARRRMGEGRPLAALRKDGSSFPVEVALQPLAGPHGPVVVTMVVDVSERGRLLGELRRAATSLEEQVQQRTAELQRVNRDNMALLNALRAKSARLERLSREDPLTGLANRRDFRERLDSEIERADGLGLPLSVALFDIDHFKRINDQHGHAVGDLVLRACGALLRRKCRATDAAARFGGEEFALIMPDAELRDAAGLCERIRLAFAAFSWASLHQGVAVTLSAGVAQHESGEPARAVLSAADANLYAAKNRGRNRVVWHQDGNETTQPTTS